MKTITRTSQNGRWGLSVAYPDDAQVSHPSSDLTLFHGLLPARGAKKAGHEVFQLVPGDGHTLLASRSVSAVDGGGVEILEAVNLQGNGDRVSLAAVSPQGGVVEVFGRHGGSEYLYVGAETSRRLCPAEVAVMFGAEFEPPTPAPAAPSGSVAAALAKAGLL